jgi:hypothetical protein
LQLHTLSEPPSEEAKKLVLTNSLNDGDKNLAVLITVIAMNLSGEQQTFKSIKVVL